MTVSGGRSDFWHVGQPRYPFARARTSARHVVSHEWHRQARSAREPARSVRGSQPSASAATEGWVSARDCPGSGFRAMTSAYPAGYAEQVVTATLPDWQSVLAVVAHPDDESFGLGAILSAFVARGARVTVLCFTHGEASTLHGVDGDLAQVRERELQAAAAELGLGAVVLRDYPDGALTEVEEAVLWADVSAMAAEVGADGLVVFDPDGVTGHPDHQRATAVALVAAASAGIPVLGWTIPDRVATTLRDELGAPFTGHPDPDIDLVITVDRARQRRAVDCHPSQAVPGSALWRRLELLGDREHLRWLRVS